MSQTFEQKVNKIIRRQFKKYKIKEHLSEFDDVNEAYKQLAPPNLNYQYFTDGQKPKMAFKPEAKEYELINAWWLMQASLLAFAEPKDAKKRFRQAGFAVQFIENKHTSTQCYILEKENFVIVAFRGSQVKKVRASLQDVIIDWMTNGKLDLVESGIGGKVHRGFKEAFLSIWDRHLKTGNLRDALEKANQENKAIWFTGHSLGSALATIAASYYQGYIQGLYTFGSPRVGDSDFVDALTRKLSPLEIYRFIYKDDIVTKLPLTDLSLDVYKHIGIVRYINNHSVIEDSPNPIIKLAHDLKTTIKNILAELGHIIIGHEKIKLRAKLISEILITVAPTGIPNHAPIYYAIAIDANLRAK